MQIVTGTTEPDLPELYFRMALIRRFEERLLDHFGKKQLTGTTHTYIGQEATAVSALSFLSAGDIVCSQHRSHGYFLAAGGDPRALFLEIVGDSDGVCEGIGGSQHLHTPCFFSNGILGGVTGLAAGLALAEKLLASGNIVVSFLGDGTLGEGLTYESFNIASLWQLPILFVIENNRYAQTTPIALNLSGSIAKRPAAFGIRTDEIESNDVLQLRERFRAAFAAVRSGAGPFCQIVHTYRLGPHSKGDDLRSEAELGSWRRQDPLAIAETRLGAEADEIRRRADRSAAAATELPTSLRVLPAAALAFDEGLIPADYEPRDGWRIAGAGKWMVEHLQQVFLSLLEAHPEIYLLGEDILDPYGGAFKVYRGLSSAFPKRVLTTPVSEAGVVAVANGLAISGYRPIVEVMFGDFTTLALDQLVNHAAKFAGMYRRGAACPTILRAPFGGYRGYGPTHSQSLEKLFFGIPGLVVTTSDPIHDPLLLWQRMLALSAPCVHVENKMLYGTELPDIADDRLGPFRLKSSRAYFPTTTLSLGDSDEALDVAILAYGGMVPMAMDASLALFRDDEIRAGVIVPSLLAPLPAADLEAALRNARALIVLEEGTERAGFGAEVVAHLAAQGALAHKRVSRCAARNTVIPNNAELERQVLPSLQRLIDMSRRICM